MKTVKRKAGRPAKYDWSKWDENLNIEENCKKLGIGFVYGYRQCYRLKKKFRKSHSSML